ncbi:MAG: HNH endonuclease [Actinomycetota bacterium]|nr:HNH endonuclease [Actinomycetota bacterium]
MSSLDNAPAYPRPTDGYGPPWMSEEEYLCSVREVPDEVLDAAPEGMPEELWLAAVTAEAELMADPLTDAPGVLLAGSLAEGVDPGCRDGALLDRITGYERQASWAAAGQARAIGELGRRRVAADGVAELACFADEVALALTCTRQAAWARVHTAMELVDRLPDTLGSLAEGRICVARVRIIAEGTRPLSDAHAALVQAEVLAAAEVLTPSKLRVRVAAAVAAVDPRDAQEQHEDACASRAVHKYPREHGMTGIWALLPADHAALVWAAVNTHAQHTREPGDQRTADQRRADSLAELMTAYLTGTCVSAIPGPGRAFGEAAQSCTAGGHRPPPVPAWCQVQVKISADWLLGRTTEAPILGGHGPLPADVALRLIADAGWQRIVYHPLSGAVLDVGSTVHDPPAALRRHVLTRDGGCTQPICGNPRVDLDHNTPHPQGSTSAANLRSRCRHHHHLKQHPQWSVRAGPDGRIHWITPTGHAYPEHQPDLRPSPVTQPRTDDRDDAPVATAVHSEDYDDPPPF